MKLRFTGLLFLLACAWVTTVIVNCDHSVPLIQLRGNLELPIFQIRVWGMAPAELWLMELVLLAFLEELEC